MAPRDIDSREVFVNDISEGGACLTSFLVPPRRKSVAQPPARFDSTDCGSEVLRSSKRAGIPGGDSGRDAVLSCRSIVLDSNDEGVGALL